MRPDPFDTPEIQPAQARLILALALSLALHLALAFLVQVTPAHRPEARVKVLHVDLAGRVVADSRQTHEARPPAPPQKPEQAIQPEPAPVAPALPDVALDQPSAPPVAPVQPMLAPKSPLPAVDIPLVEDPIYYTARQVDVHPAANGPVTPVFPEAAAQGGVEGFVTLRLLIDDGGVVREISVVEAQPPDTFEAAASSAFRNARFSPALRNGRPVKSDVLIRVTFELVNRAGK